MRGAGGGGHANKVMCEQAARGGVRWRSGEESFRQKEQCVQRPQVLEEQHGGPGGWSRVHSVCLVGLA